MNIRIGNEIDKEYILNSRPQAASLFKGRSYFIIAEDEGILGFAVVFHRDIEAPVPVNEAFINLIEVLDESNHKKGIASCLVQKIIEMEEEKNTYQVRAYCEINNIASHRLWLKNGFGISPVKEANGQIPGSFVTYVCKQ